MRKLTFFTTLLLLGAAPAFATPPAACDKKALGTEATSGTPEAAAKAWVALSDPACDPAGAKALAPKVFPRLVADEFAVAAARTAINLGISDAPNVWLGALQSDERARMLKALGESCATEPKVAEHLVAQASSMGETFWDQRWYRAAEACNVPAFHTLLLDKLAKTGGSSDKARWGSILETYARAVGPAAIPHLKELITKASDVEVQGMIIQAFVDAARGGPKADQEKGAEKARTAAIAAIMEAAPGLKPKAAEPARSSLQALNDEVGADQMAGVRYQAKRQADGKMLWGVITVESATCKNGKSQRRMHVGAVREPGTTWPDQLKERVEGSMGTTWPMDLAKSCKGEGSIELHLPGEPFESQAALDAWVESRLKELADPKFEKSVRVNHDPLDV
jgi:hypothetical protein